MNRTKLVPSKIRTSHGMFFERGENEVVQGRCGPGRSRFRVLNTAAHKSPCIHKAETKHKAMVQQG